MSVTSGQYRRLDQSFTAVDVRNAVFQWPYGHQHTASGDKERGKPWQNKGQKGKKTIVCFSILYKLYAVILKGLTVPVMGNS